MVIVQLKDGQSIDVLPKDYNVKSKIHEYGGGAAGMSVDGKIVFTDAETDGVFRVGIESDEHSGVVDEIVHGSGDGKVRYADFDVHPIDTGVVLAIQEVHQGEEVVNRLVVIEGVKKEVRIVVEGADFYSHPKFSPDGRKVSWIQWMHPDMPWIGTEVYVAEWVDGKVEKIMKIAGEAGRESIVQPKWHTDGTLLYGSDKTGVWQLYRWDSKVGVSEHLEVEEFHDAELGAGEWTLGK